MIGLMFFGAIGLWVVVAIVLGQKIPQWLKLKPAWGFLFVPLVLFVPVWDEIIAWPQMQMLCRHIEGYQFAPGMDEKSAKGRSVYYMEISTPFQIFPSTVMVEKWEYQYVDVVTKQPVFVMPAYGVRRGWLGIPAGSSGTKMTAIVKGCSKGLAKEEIKIKDRFRQLSITEKSVLSLQSGELK